MNSLRYCKRNITNAQGKRGMDIVTVGKQSFAVVAYGLWMQLACGEVILDGSLGSSGALTGPNYAVTENLGQLRGSNLFHSFSDFNLNSSETAVFSGSASINNIISRVTGGNASSIDGTFRSTINGADFYFINPNGVVFGQNATLDVSGSFYTSTADYLKLGFDGRFDASTPSNSVLTTSSPAAFGFLDNSVASISVNGSHLAVGSGKTLGLIGGDININGMDEAYEALVGPWNLSAPNGRVELVSVASAGEYLLGSNELSGFTQLGNISLEHAATVSASAGTVFVRANNLNIESSYLTSSFNNETTAAAIGIDISLAGDMKLSIGESGLRKDAEVTSSSYSAANAGSIRIVAGKLVLVGDSTVVDINETGATASIHSIAFSTGNSGDVEIQATDIDMGNNARILTETNAAGAGGDITIDTNQLTISSPDGNGSYISSSSYSTGQAGNITVNAEDIYIKGGGTKLVGISSQVADPSNSAVDSGDITVSTKTLTLLDGGQIETTVFSGSGQAGDIKITSNDIYIAGVNSGGYSAGIYSSTSGWTTSGNGGNISLNTKTLLMEKSARIEANSYSFGAAGNVDITADSIRLVSGGDEVQKATAITAASGWVGAGAGNVTVTADSLEIIDGAELGSYTVGWGDGGVVNINVNDLLVSGIDAFANVSSKITASTYEYFYPNYATGNGGSININAKNVNVNNGGEITALSQAIGDGGNVNVNANNINVSNGGSINAKGTRTGSAGNLFLTAYDSIKVDHASISTSSLSGNGGDITVRAKNLLYLNESVISTSVQGGNGGGGNIDIDPIFIVLDSSKITANAEGGNGGNITLVAENLLLSPDSEITASSNLGVDGTVVVNAPSSNLGSELETVPEASQDASKLFRNDCVAVGSGFSRFVTAKGGSAQNGSRNVVSSNYYQDQTSTLVSQTKPANVSLKKNQKPALILAKKGVDCMAKSL